MRFLFLAYAEFYDPFITKIIINIAYQDLIVEFSSHKEPVDTA